MKNKINLFIAKYRLGSSIMADSYHNQTKILTDKELRKRPLRFDIINFLLNTFDHETKYLEIGLRYPEDNFDMVNSTFKCSVDPGYENSNNPATFKMESDEFFKKLAIGEILEPNIKFDVIFIDGLHLAEQVERDINNSLIYIRDNGYIVLHDCNPPSEFHASETYDYKFSPSNVYWNGTTWKAFFKFRKNPMVYSCCIDTDWGIGIISKNINIGTSCQVENPYFEFRIFEKNRKKSLNLISFQEFKSVIE